jgi:hypothetical protein
MKGKDLFQADDDKLEICVKLKYGIFGCLTKLERIEY